MTSHPRPFAEGQPPIWREATDERRAKVGRVIFATAGALWLGALLLTSFDVYEGCPGLKVFASLGVLVVVTSAWALHSARIRTAGWVFSLGHVPLLIVCTSACRSTSSVGPLLIVLVLVATVLLGRKATQILAILSGIGLCLSAFSVSAELRQAPSFSAIPDGWPVLICSLLAVSLLAHQLTRSMEQVERAADEASREREEVESRYLSARKLEPVGQLASGVAHDFNNLLSVMVSVSDGLHNECEKNSEIEELLSDLDEATARASQMTGQLLAFSRRRSFDVESVDLDELLTSVTPMLSRLLGDEITVNFHGSTGGLSVEADRGQLEQVVLNLAVNARDAMPQGGVLDICLGQQEGDSPQVFLEVSDTGKGIPKDIIPQVFTPFFTTKPTGTGLGLSTVHDIVHRLCGTIDVQSEPLEGTRFFITLPASDKQVEAPRPSVRGQMISHPDATRVLLAEDHDLLRRSMRRNLKRAGYSVTTALNGQEAMWLMDGGGCFEFLICDISMPQMGGIELLQNMARRGHVIPTLLMSGNVTHLPRELESCSIPTRFLPKPFTEGDLMEAIDKCLTQLRPGSGGRKATRTGS